MRSKIKRWLFGNHTEPKRVRAGLLRGLDFTIDPNHKSQRLIGFDEREIAAVTRRLVCGVKTCVDIGANDGWYTLFFATRGNVREVFAGEPDQKCVGMLERNLSLNKDSLKAKITIVPKFVGTGSGLNCISVDKMLKGSTGPFLLKIDVDGGELDVLRSAETLLRGSNTYLIVETHSVELERDCIEILKDFGYKSCLIKNGWYRAFIPELRPIPHNRWFYAAKN